MIDNLYICDSGCKLVSTIEAKVLSLGCFEQQFVEVSYSGYWLKKYSYPKSVLDSAVVKFRPNSGYMDFFN